VAGRMRQRSALLVGFVLFAVAGCGGEDADVPQAEPKPATVTVSETVRETVTAAPEPEPAPEPVDTEASLPPSEGEKIAVPDVVGLDHQLAQDTMQAAGLYDLAEEDASGQGRLLLWDRNWTVVSQDPAAGTLVNEDRTITLRSKKDDE
jgi:hypothetical protein